MTSPDSDALTRSEVSLQDMKDYLNKSDNDQDDELAEFLVAGVERVEAHLGRELALPTTALQRLAVKVATGTYWSTQRWRDGSGTGAAGRGSWASGEAIRADSGPGGMAPLEFRLTELLGPPAVGGGENAPTGPIGSFPPPMLYPDPVVPLVRSW